MINKFIKSVGVDENILNLLIHNGFDDLEYIVEQLKSNNVENNNITLDYNTLTELGNIKPAEKIKILIGLDELAENVKFNFKHNIYHYIVNNLVMMDRN